MANFFVTKRDLNFRTYGGKMNGSMTVARTNVFCVLIEVKCQWNMGYQLVLFLLSNIVIELWYGIIIWWHISYKIYFEAHFLRNLGTSVLEYMRNLLFGNGHIVVQSSIIPVMGFACNPVKYECINTSQLHEMRDLLLFSGPGLIWDDLQPQPLSLSPPVDVVHPVQNTDISSRFLDWYEVQVFSFRW